MPHILVHLFLRVLNLQSGKLLADYNTTKQRTNLFFQVTFHNQYLTLCLSLDEVKWGLRLPTVRAHRAYTLDYEDKVQEQVLAYLGNKVTHDYLDGSKDLNLDLTVTEAE